MPLKRIEMEGFRCISAAAIELSPGVNVFGGDNGSGKTSLLEAVHMLSTGRSFRAREPDQTIQDGRGDMLIRGLVGQATERVRSLALRREKGRTTIRLDGSNLSSSAQLARVLPVSVVTPDTHVEMQASPKARRRWLDVTLFHVKPGFLDIWKRYMRSIKHRNALLRRRGSAADLDAWDKQVAILGTELHDLRAWIFFELQSQSRELQRAFIGDDGGNLEYQRGWGANLTLEEALIQARTSDAALGVSRVGPHRGDLLFSVGARPIASRLSRGQLKLWIGALMLAQALVIARMTGTFPMLLVDDLVSDLDRSARRRLISQLAGAGCQLLITTTEAGNVPIPAHLPSAMFHVKHGAITQTR